MIPGMIVCSAVQKRQSDSGAKRADLAYFIAVARRFAKLQLIVEWPTLSQREDRRLPRIFDRVASLLSWT
jgi:hypothetical protein